VAAAFPVLRLCSGVVLPLEVGSCSSAYAVSCVADAEDDARFLPGIMSFASRPCEAGRRRPLVGDVGREDGEETVDCGEVAEMVGIGLDISEPRSSVAGSVTCSAKLDPLRPVSLGMIRRGIEEGCIVERVTFKVEASCLDRDITYDHLPSLPHLPYRAHTACTIAQRCCDYRHISTSTPIAGQKGSARLHSINLAHADDRKAACGSRILTMVASKSSLVCLCWNQC